MGKKIPGWQVALVFILMIVLLYWGVMVDEDAGEGHVVLRLCVRIHHRDSERLQVGLP